ncbi:MAG: tRNA (N(6)-L-threonylcarbamoyladenosine(37)-C(2))-methylthiotransferase MtaB [Cellulosilyticaceae bacterium]
MKKSAFYTLGCKVNQYDTEAVMENFKNSGYEIVPFDEYADVYVVNTCTVTHLSDRKCRQMLRKTKKINPNSILVAMGCYAQSAGEKIKTDVEEVDIIVGTNHRQKIVELVEQFKEDQVFNLVDDIMEVTEFEELTISNMDERTRVYLKIQEGCNNYCTYCIIPYVRGKIRSRKEENVLAEAERLVASGFKEIVLAGIHVASYGKDLEGTSLIQVIERLNEVEGLERIRLSSIEPVVVTEAFTQALPRLTKLCRHFHLSLQSGSDTVLKRMNRKYTTAEYLESVRRLRAVWPDVAITTDIIVGFPGESEEEFKETMAFVEEVGFAQVHLFPYSTREGTVAAKMKDQIAPQVKDDRVTRLKAVCDASRQGFISGHIGQVVEVLFETIEDGIGTGYTSNYLKVHASVSEEISNTVRQVKIDTIEGDVLIGTLISS